MRRKPYKFANIPAVILALRERLAEIPRSSSLRSCSGEHPERLIAVVLFLACGHGAATVAAGFVEQLTQVTQLVVAAVAVVFATALALVERTPRLRASLASRLFKLFSLLGVLATLRSRTALAVGSAGHKAARLALLAIPKNRREEIEGDFFESLEQAREEGHGKVFIALLAVAKCVLIAWAVFRLRTADLFSGAVSHRKSIDK